MIKKNLILLILACLIISSCKKKIIQDKVYDNIIYDVGNVKLYQSAADKKRIKTPTQFISIMYADLFQKSITTQELNDLSVLYSTEGDKGLMTEMLVSNYMNSSAIKMPSNSDMRNDIDKFLNETFIRFYLRNPTSYEKYYFKNLIQNDANVTPELVYSSFALSDEYWFY
jgi:hypothetical protein